MHQNSRLQDGAGDCWSAIVCHFTDHPPEKSLALFLKILKEKRGAM